MYGLSRRYQKTYEGVRLKSGHFYKFKYRPFRRDPRPLIIFMHSIEGTHEKSGHQWRLFQAINFTYVPRAMRKRFLKVWLDEMDKPGNIKFTWQKVLRKYRYIQMGIRRYQFKPAGYITGLEEIPRDRIEKEVIKSLSKDFSKSVATRLRGLMFRRKQEKERKRKAKLKAKRNKQRKR